MVHRVIVEDQSLRWYGRPPKIADNSVEFVQLQFHLPEEWASLLLVAQFTQSETYNMLITEDVCFLPVELKPGLCQVSLFGYSEGKPLRATSIPLVFQIEESGFVSSAEAPIPPTPDLYAQLIEYFSSISGTGGVVDPAEIQKIVTEYLVANPPQVQETDPTVPEWAKYPTKPSYTAAEVGAQPAGNYLTEIEIKPVIEAANSAQALAKQADKKVDTLREVVSKFHSNIVEEAKGDIITLDDASDMELAGLTLYGKTTQNGTPTPDYPVELESVGAGGSVAVTVCGKNLLKNTATTKTVNGVTFTVNADGSVTANGTATADSRLYLGVKASYPAGKYVITGTPQGGSQTTFLMGAYAQVDSKNTYTIDTGNGITFDAEESLVMTGNQSPCIIICQGYTVNNLTFYPMLRIASVADSTYEPYKGQTLTAQTPNGLPGIRVSNGGNYTDENGQQWICDEIDFARGKYVQRCVKVTSFGMSKEMTSCVEYTAEVGRNLISGIALCNKTNLYQNSSINDIPHMFVTENGYVWLYLPRGVDVADAVMLVATAEPIENDLTAEEIAAYAALHTNKPNTTVYNDSGAGMNVEYVADTKLYIDNKFAELASAIVNNV